MELTKAISLIEPAISRDETQHWADLGSGNGLFTQALATVLGKGSSIRCIDSDAKALERIPVITGIDITKKVADFTRVFPLEQALDGIIMANSLHFVQDKQSLLSDLKTSLRSGGRLIIIEYDINSASVWVPYPIPFADLELLGRRCGFDQITLIHRVSSKYNQQGIYSALLQAN